MSIGSENAIHIKNLTVNYRHTPAISSVDLDVPRGEFLGVIGPNGGGKTTLLKAILGLVTISEGKIEVFGNNVNEKKTVIAYVPQFSFVDRKFPISTLEVVLTAFLKGSLHPFFRHNRQQRKVAMETLELIGISDLADRQISELSGGEFQRLLIARAIASKPEILLLDEPTSSVDPVSRDNIYKLLADLNKSVTIVMATHDMMAISSEVSSIACLNQHLVYHGAPRLDEKIVNSMYGCPVDLIAHGVPHRVLKKHEHCIGESERKQC